MWSLKGLAVVAAVAFCLALSLSTTTALPPPWPATTQFLGRNIDGQLLVLDVGSLTPDNAINSYAKCEQACKLFAGCNAFVYCDRVGGCGDSCGAYVGTNQKLPVSTNDYKTQPLPIVSFGANVAGNGCVGTAWRNGLCTLKKVANPSAPTFFKAEAGWNAGTIDLQVPHAGGCQGMPLEYCYKCSDIWTGAPSGPTNEDTGYNACMACGAAAGKIGANTLERASRAFATCGFCWQRKQDGTSYNPKQCFTYVSKHLNGLFNLGQIPA